MGLPAPLKSSVPIGTRILSLELLSLLCDGGHMTQKSILASGRMGSVLLVERGDTGQEEDVNILSQLLCLCSASQQCEKENGEILSECSRQVREFLSLCLILQGKAYWRA